MPLDTSGTASAFSEQGLVSLYQKDGNNIFSLVDHIVSPEPQNTEHFGNSIKFGTNSMYISAPGYTTQAGHVGVIRRFNYATVINASSPYNPVGSTGTTLSLTSTIGIRAGMTVSGVGFTNQYVVSVLSSTLLELSLAPTSIPSGIISFTTTSWVLDSINVYLSPAGTSAYATKFNISADNTVLVASGLANNSYGSVYVYKGTPTITPTQIITGSDVFFGVALTLTDSGNYLAIGDIITTVTKIDQGSVTIYKFNSSNNQFNYYQSLTNHSAKSSGYFGTNLSFMNGENTLVVYSQDEDTSQLTTFDTITTTFDKKSTAFSAQHTNSGRIDVYDRYANKWVYSETLQTSSQTTDGYGLGFAVGANHILVGAPYSLDSGFKSGKIYDYSKNLNSYSWNVLHYEVDKPNPNKIKNCLLYTSPSPRDGLLSRMPSSA